MTQRVNFTGGGPLDGTGAMFDKRLKEFHSFGFSNKVQVSCGGTSLTVGCDHRYDLAAETADGELVYEYRGAEG